MNKSKLVETKTRQIVDVETGELINQSIEKHFVTKVKTENFFMVFIDQLSGFYGVKSPMDKNLIMAMCGYADYNSTEVRVTPAVKREICELIGLNPTNFSKSIVRLKEANLITGTRGDYKLNPSIFWKGTTSTRATALLEDGITFQITFKADK